MLGLVKKLKENYGENIANYLNPLTPRSDQHETSPYNILTLSSKQVMRIFRLIKQMLLTWSNTKFSNLIYKEMGSR